MHLKLSFLVGGFPEPLALSIHVAAASPDGHDGAEESDADESLGDVAEGGTAEGGDRDLLSHSAAFSDDRDERTRSFAALQTKQASCYRAGARPPSLDGSLSNIKKEPEKEPGIQNLGSEKQTKKSGAESTRAAHARFSGSSPVPFGAASGDETGQPQTRCSVRSTGRRGRPGPR